MANEEHLKILKQGVDVWNKWRRAEENFTLRPDLRGADLSEEDLREGYFRDVDFSGANLIKTNFKYANLSGSDFKKVRLFRADLSNVKGVLILGRFTKERKAVLDSIRNKLRELGYVPMIFDFEKPTSKDLTETISALAHMARFIIADITEPKSVPHELATIVPTLSVPVKPLLLKGSTGEYAMFKDLRGKYHWVLAVYRYKDQKELVETFEPKVIGPAEKKAKALIKRKNR